MSPEDREKAIEVADAERGEPPGMGAALLTVLVMILTTAVVAFLIYLVMVAVRPIEARHFKKATEIELPVVHAARVHPTNSLRYAQDVRSRQT